MVSNISWIEYFTGTVITWAFYYFIVAVCFYRREIIGLLAGNKNNPVKAAKADAEEPVEELEGVVYDLNAILGGAGTEADKSDLLSQIKERLASFAGLRQPAYRVAITKYIIGYSKTFCGITFSEEELEEAWKTLLS